MNHIKYEDGMSWCGDTLDSNFYFKDIEQVTINNFHGERLVCQYCLRAVMISLLTVPKAVQLTPPAHYSTLEGYGGTI